MAKGKWMLASTSPKKNVIITEAQKKKVSNAFIEIIDGFKEKCIKSDPDKTSIYLIDIYSKWYRNYFYLCEKYKAEFENRIADELETKFVRLEYCGNDCYNFSYFRHTGQWHVVANCISLQECMDSIMENPVFQPISV